MALTTAYRNQLTAQFLESYVTFIFKKRRVAELLAKGDLTVDEANQLAHFQQDIIHDRGVFQLWRQKIIDEDGYTLAQIKTYILNRRAAVMEILRARWVAAVNEINALKDEVAANATTEEDLANLPNLLAELDTRITKRQFWHDLVIELRDKVEAEFATEAEMG